MVPPITEAIAHPSDKPRHETESFENVARISLGCSTITIELTVQPLASVISIVCKPAGAFVFAFTPPKLQLKLYVGVPPVTETDTKPSV